MDYLPGANIALLEKAYVFVSKAYRGKSTLPGEPYLDHPLAVAAILARMRLDEESIAAGLLHDSLEKEYITSEELISMFGPDVAPDRPGRLEADSNRLRSREKSVRPNISGR